MKNLVINNNGQPVTNSLLVAEKFGKQHKHVLDSIRNLTAQNSAVSQMFYETTYYNEQNKQQPIFIMNRDGFTLLVMGFTGKDALRFKLDFIEAFNRMEAIIREALTINVEAVQRNIKRRYLLNTELQKVNRDLNELMKRHKAIKKELRDIDISDFAQLRLFPAYNIEPVKLGFPNTSHAI
ncbi:MAG: Rha family transcriptional regulator [Prevotellaceae bacterium]|jgi:Rha family phage regulatory protein|nr:Rha family transcriptional regulator [Prevotellaceae bacterium]